MPAQFGLNPPNPSPHYIYYNGFTFPQLAKYTVSSETIPSENGFTTYGTKTTVHIEFLITANDPIPGGPYGGSGSTTNSDGTLDPVSGVSAKLKQILSEPNQEFAMINTGFGDIVLGRAYTPAAITYPVSHYVLVPGPVVNVSTFTPVGYNTVAGFVVDITFVAKEGANGTVNSGGGANAYTDFYLERGFDIDDQSRTVRTSSGKFKLYKIFKPETVNYSVKLDLKQLLDYCVKPLSGFLRKQTYNVMGDGITVNFTITDTEIPSDFAYPKGAHDLSKITYTVESGSPALGLGTTQWTHTVAGTIVRAPSTPMSTYWELMLWVIRGRIAAAVGSGSTAKNIIFRHLQVEENPFDWTAGFNFTYTWQATYSLEDLLKNSGLFKGYGTNWKDWQEYRNQNGYTAQYGGMDFTNEMEVKATNGLPNRQTPSRLLDNRKDSTYGPGFNYTPAGPINPLAPAAPPPGQDWLFYNIQIDINVDGRAATIYKGSPRVPSGTRQFTVPGGPQMEGSLVPTNQGGAPAVGSASAGPTVSYITVYIMAGRIKRHPVIARLKDVGGVSVTVHTHPQIKKSSVPLTPGVMLNMVGCKTVYVVDREVTTDLLSSLNFTFDQVAK
jgi:hypothetical protein